MVTQRAALVLGFAFMLFATSCYAVKQPDIYIGPKRQRVFITNGLKSENLTFHCQSNDDDLSVQTLVPGAMWGFKFRVNVWGTTQFFCRFAWPGIDFRYFDIYIQTRDVDKCNDCCWNITPYGPCRCTCFGPCDNLECYHWNPK